MADPARYDKMLGAWLAAHREISKVHGVDGPTFAEVQAAAPGLAMRIGDAEKRAEEKSVAWVNGGPGGVQASIDEWRDLWIEAIQLVRDARN